MFTSVVRCAANLCVEPIIILALLGARTVVADRPFDVLAANDAVRVFEDGLVFASGRAAKDGTITVVIRKGENKKQLNRHFRLQFDPEPP